MKTTKETNIVFWGTPEICIPYLESLKNSGYKILAVVTNPDRKVGRKQIITPSPVKLWGQENNIEVLQPEKLDDEFKSRLQEINPDVSIVVAFGKIIPQDIINIPEKGTLNVHYSLLPKWRGASPVEAAILAGDEFTGVSIQKMVFKLDAGPLVSEEVFELQGSETAPDLKNTLSEIGAKLLAEILEEYIDGTINLQEQDEKGVTTCSIITKEEGEIHLSDNDQEKWNKYRAYFGWPGIFYFDQSGKRIKITEATFEDGKFEIKKIIPEGGKEITWEQYKK